MKKLKAFVISFLITSLFIRFLSVSAEDSIDFDKALGVTIATSGLLVDKLAGVGAGAVTAVAEWALENPLDAGGDSLSIQIPTYLFSEGKYNFQYHCNGDNKDHEVLVRFSMFRTDYAVNYQDGKYIQGDDGLKYIPNCLYYSISFDDGSYYRYRLEYRNQYYISQLQPSQIIDTNGSINVSMRGGAFDLYDVSDGNTYGTFVMSSVENYLYDSVLKKSPTNSIIYRYSNAPGNSLSFATYPPPRYSWQADYSLNYPDPVGICFNYISARSVTGSSGSSVIIHPDFYMSWSDTNNQNIYNRLNTYNTQNNYSYNSTFKNGDIINYNNVNNYYNGNLSPVFNPDGSINTDVNLPDLLKPSLEIALGDLKSKIENFFKNMPDLDFPFDISLPGGGGNNYFDLPGFPDIDLPDIPGGGDGGTVWNPPKYKALNTTPIITTRSNVELVEVTFPTSVIQNGGKILESGLDGLTDCMPELVSVALVCMVFGFLWKFTGG